MSAKPPRTERLVWIGLGLTIALLLLASLLALLKVRAGFGKSLPLYGQVADFALTNQNGQRVSLADLRGHVWVADIIFTRCAGPCLKMSRQMMELQQALPKSSAAKLISLTTDPEFDTPSVLKGYAERFEANPNRWTFLTGTKKQIAALAIESLKLTAIEKKPEEQQSPVDLFIHSTIFVLVDKHGQLRGVYETTGEGTDSRQVKAQLLAGIRRLEHE
ncbi:MAG TPA: SCO family protein [Candidatus Limnocylindrales bacterium]|nr:SCO family protein [Candidatus Limnocylindrales bacterium]